MTTKTNTYVVTGATGQIGSKLAQILLARGQKVRVLTRDAAKVQALVAAGAEAAVGASDDVAYLTRAFAGADAVFAVTPPPYGAANYRAAQNVLGSALAAAIKASGVRKVVNLSSSSAHLERTGPIRGLTDQERRLDALGIDVLHLRPAYFMENLAFSLDPIKSMGVVGSPLRPEASLSMVATKDIAAAAAARLLALDFTGTSMQQVLGERDVTMADVARALSEATGKTYGYVQFLYDAAAQAMVGAGLSADSAAQLIEMYQGFNDGYLVNAASRDARSTTGTSIEEFAQEFAAAFGLRG